MKTKSILILITAVILAACGGKSAKTSADGQQAAQQQTQSAEDAFKSECQKTMQQVDVLQRKLADPQQYTTLQGVDELQRLGNELSLNYNAAELDSADLAMAQQVNELIIWAIRTSAFVTTTASGSKPLALCLTTSTSKRNILSANLQLLSCCTRTIFFMKYLQMCIYFSYLTCVRTIIFYELFA